MKLKEKMPANWSKILAEEFKQSYFKKLEAFVLQEYEKQPIYPPLDQVFAAFEYAAFEDVKVLLLGQDPYHGEGQAHGLSFSVRSGVKIPPSLRNIFKELNSDIGCDIPQEGCLTDWAKQGILLLNAVLTVRKKEAASHASQGWETFTDAIIRKLSDRQKPLVFLLWGGYARKKAKLIDIKRHIIIESAHPSPLSAKKFLGTRPFSQVNEALQKLGYSPINWQLENSQIITKKP
ncbi:uracil-DNA glycosylase [Spirulina sp. 06S082]|uniref:uracil-DNA glycosylase n=1 Tax=Spirulina sp. 06S082 TaxID=3110248 RepID=UPI002B20527D|nr:uracil-DNA glycosylase [Spirulina sp. 06S082]MEA5468988.1 uracil-DNA glycosylase [Spirulina sp. 06S082]